MINQNDPFDQLPLEIKAGFNALNITKHLKNAGFKKKFGFTCLCLFRLIFTLLFHQKNWFRLLESNKGESLPGKDAVYRFLNFTRYNWRRSLISLSSEVITNVEKLTSNDRITAFIIDDSMYERNRSKMVELLARFKDHATGAFYKGFRMLTLGWSDGHTLIPVDFSLLSSMKSRLTEMSEDIDKRTVGYKRRLEALLPAPQGIVAMIDRAIEAGLSASYTLMDSWFTQPPLVRDLLERGMHVIGMVKNDNKRYLVDDQKLSLKELCATCGRTSPCRTTQHSHNPFWHSCAGDFYQSPLQKEGMASDSFDRLNVNPS